MGTKPEYAPLLDAAASIGLDDLRATLKVRRRKINGRLSDLPLLIAENRKTEAGLGEVPYDSLRASLSDLEEDEHRLTGEIAASEAGDVQGLQNRLDALRLDLASLEQDNQAHRREQAAKAPDRIGLADKVAFYGQRLQTLMAAYNGNRDRYHQYKQQAAVHEASRMNTAGCGWRRAPKPIVAPPRAPLAASRCPQISRLRSGSVGSRPRRTSWPRSRGWIHRGRQCPADAGACPGGPGRDAPH